MAEQRRPPQGGAKPTGTTTTTAAAEPKKEETRAVAPTEQVRQVLNRMRDQLERVLPNRLNVDRFLQVATNAILRNPTLIQCDKISIMQGAMEAAQLGLQLDGVTGHAYLLPFWNERNKRFEAKMIPGYRGYIALMHRTGEVGAVECDVVCENDHFDYHKGTDGFLRHRPFDGTIGTYAQPGTRGAWLGAYCVIHFRDERRPHFDYVRTPDILAIKARSPSVRRKVHSAWDTDEAWMWRKTAIRQTAKTAPLSPEIVELAVRDEYADAGIDVGVGSTDAEFAAAVTQAHAEDLKRKYRGEETGGAPPGDEPPSTGEGAEGGGPLSAEDNARLDQKIAEEDARREAGKSREPGED